ncbi:unnamed protein product [Paramecium sonneborni]|uniref:Uncharacterized protein n=1 Tax=Paramecium sonneborni TaxID=65129 RepID=A0A8S1NSK6_9CILI|nr:unnamed protein product [Paramecium sonneborni]
MKTGQQRKQINMFLLIKHQGKVLYDTVYRSFLQENEIKQVAMKTIKRLSQTSQK